MLLQPHPLVDQSGDPRSQPTMTAKRNMSKQLQIRAWQMTDQVEMTGTARREFWGAHADGRRWNHSGGYKSIRERRNGLSGILRSHWAIISCLRPDRETRERTKLHVVCLNFDGSLWHRLVDYALSFFHVPESIQHIISRYVSNLTVYRTTQQNDIDWSVELPWDVPSPPSCILFVVAFKVILWGARQVIGGVKPTWGERVPPLRSYMVYVTSIL